MQHKWFSSTAIGLSILLMALPCSVTLGSSQHSHLSLASIYMGNWFPLLAMVFSVLALIFLLSKRDYGQMSPVCLILAMASQGLSWYFFGSFSLIGAASMLLHLSVLLQKHIPAPHTQSEPDS